MQTLRWFVCAAAAALAGVADAQSFDLSVLPASSATIQSDAVLVTSGVLIGDYDPATNPDGTQTRPGFFGGSGNQPIDAEVDLIVEGGGTTTPTGGFTLDADFGAGTATIAGLALDLLGGAVLPADLGATLMVDTFHTVNPSMIYPGGVEIPIDLGQVGAVQAAAAVQSGEAVGVLTATGDPDVFDLSVAVPVELTMEVAVTPPGGETTVTPVGPVAAVLPLVGQVTRAGGTVSLTAAVGPLEDAQEFDLGGVELPAVPLELPTLGTETAGVVLTLSAQTLTVDLAIDAVLVAEGAACAADWNGDGVLDFFDAAGFLADFSAQDDAADLNGDGVFDFFDVQSFLGAFAAGCG